MQGAVPLCRGYRGAVSIDSPPAITITVRLFASPREAAVVGRCSSCAFRPQRPQARCGAICRAASAATGPPTACAMRSTTSGGPRAYPLRDGDEVALVLPVSGG